MQSTARSILSLVAAGLAACGGNQGEQGTDYAPLFVGDWYGQAKFTFASTGQTDSSDVLQKVVVLGKNHLRLPAFCSDSDPGPEADVTSATQFQVRPYTCALSTQPCQQTLSLTGGSGTLSAQMLALTFAGAITAAGGAGCQSRTTQFTITFSGTHDPNPPAPQGLVAIRGDFYGRFLLSWSASTSAPLYDVQARIGNGPYQVVSAQPAVAGVSVDLDASSLPERTTVSFRIRVANRWAVSDFSNEAESRSSLVAPIFKQSRMVSTGLQISWVSRPDVSALVVERSAVQNSPAFTEVGSVDPSLATFVDTTVAEGAVYLYRAHWVDGTLVGYSSFGNQFQASLFPPSDLVAVGGVEQVKLSWVNHTAAATEIAIIRSSGMYPEFSAPDLVHLPATATRYTDHVPTGVYTYRVEARSPSFPTAATDPVFVATVLPPSLGTWSTSFIDEPFATRAVPDSAGRYLLWNSVGLQRSDGAPSLVRSPSTSLAIPFPYFAVDASEQPHLVYVRQTVQGGTTMAVLHDWFDGTAWQSEEFTRTTLEKYAFTLDFSGHPVVAVSTDGTGSGLRVISWGGSGYVVENPGLSFIQPSNPLRSFLLVAGGARIHLVAETSAGETVHAWREASWSSEPVTLSSPDAQIARLAVFGNDQLALLFDDVGAVQVLERGPSGWAAPVPIVSGTAIVVSTDAALDAAPDGTPPALLIRTTEGLQLALQSEGWAPQVMNLTWPILGFGHDATDKLYAIVEVGQDFSRSPPVAHAVVFRQQ